MKKYPLKKMNSKTPLADQHAFHRITGLSSPEGDVVGVKIARELEIDRDYLLAELHQQTSLTTGWIKTVGRLRAELDQLDDENAGNCNRMRRELNEALEVLAANIRKNIKALEARSAASTSPKTWASAPRSDRSK